MGGGICSPETVPRQPSSITGPIHRSINPVSMDLSSRQTAPPSPTVTAQLAGPKPRLPSTAGIFFSLINAHFPPSGRNSWIPFCLVNLQPCAGNFPPRHMRRASPSLNYRKLSASARGCETWTKRAGGDWLEGGGWEAHFPMAGWGGTERDGPSMAGVLWTVMRTEVKLMANLQKGPPNPSWSVPRSQSQWIADLFILCMIYVAGACRVIYYEWDMYCLKH